MKIGGIPQSWQAGTQLGEREGQDTLDLRGIDRHGCGAVALPEKLFGDQTTEGMADDDGGRVEAVDDLGHVGGDVIDADVGHQFGMLPGFGDRRRLVRPPRRDGFVPGLTEEVEPR